MRQQTRRPAIQKTLTDAADYDIIWKSGARLNGKSQDELTAWLRDAG